MKECQIETSEREHRKGVKQRNRLNVLRAHQLKHENETEAIIYLMSEVSQLMCKRIKSKLSLDYCETQTIKSKRRDVCVTLSTKMGIF